MPNVGQMQEEWFELREFSLFEFDAFTHIESWSEIRNNEGDKCDQGSSKEMEYC